ncbi:MarR family winged helix-turn-helix transcriptional regulator [Nakamurella endophytica]|uniref:MarR family winged helix-turn-helix transcriptional regulator n=1 Tax=Nakamurella endophytica TaxID=1748367 RepID=UPI001E59263C|nr:MarR family transcriptional regulator [Nakamurella endophytica]
MDGTGAAVAGSASWLDAEEQRAWRALSAVRSPLETALNRQLSADSGLSTADYAVLVALSEADGRRLRARDLVRAVGWEKSRLSHQLRRMEGRGLVSRSGCETDGRAAYVQLTDQGLQAIQQAAPGHVATVRQFVIDALSRDQLRQLAEIGEAIAARLGSERCQAVLMEEIDGGCGEPAASPSALLG